MIEARTNGMKQRIVVITVSLFVLVGVHLTGIAQDKKATDQTQKQALALFEEGQYTEAKKLYNQLVTFYPNDADYNYRYGACVLYTEKDKEKALPYLEFAASQPDVDPLAYYFMGQGYHYNYRFVEAIKFYDMFGDEAPLKQIKKYGAALDKKQAQNGFQLLNSVTEPVVYERKTLSISDFHLAYKFNDPSTKLVRGSGDLLTSTDKKEETTPLIQSKKGVERIYISSYGKSTDNGLDLYRLQMDAAGDIVAREPLTKLNTPYNEAYPFFDYENNILYFASEGHNSMGGYDIFRSDYDPSTNSFGAPVNLDYAINTPDDDFLYAAVAGSGQAWFASTRNNDEGKVTVFRIDPVKRPLQTVLLTGNFKADASNRASIVVEDAESGAKVANVQSAVSSGQYVLKLPSNKKYRFLVEPDGSNVTYSGMVEIPVVKDLRPLRQAIALLDEGGQKKLVIKNLFEEDAKPEDDALIAQFLAEVSNLEVAQKQAEAPMRNLAETNEELVTKVEGDFETLEKQRVEYEDQADRAYDLAREKNALADQDLVLADQLEAGLPAQGSPTYDTKKQEVGNLRSDAANHAKQAAAAVSIAQAYEALGAEAAERKKQTAKIVERMKRADADDDRRELLEVYEAYSDNREVSTKDPQEVLKDELSREYGEVKEEALAAKKAYTDKVNRQEELTPGVEPAREKSEELALRADRLSDELRVLDGVAAAASSQVVTAAVTEADKAQITESADVNYKKVREQELSSDIAPIPADQPADEPVAVAAPSDVDGSDFIEVEQDEPTASTETDPFENVEETLEGPAPSFSYDLNESPYAAHYDDQLGAVRNESDPYLRASQEVALNEAWMGDIQREIEFLQAKSESGDLPLADAQARIDELETESLQREQAMAGAQGRLASAEPVTEPFQPTEAMMDYASVQDLEDMFFFDLNKAAKKKDVQDRLTDLNTINENYLSEIQTNKSYLTEQLASQEPGSKQYTQLSEEIQALDDLAARKQQQVDYNNAILSSSAVKYKYLPLEEVLASASLSGSGSSSVTSPSPAVDQSPAGEAQQPVPQQEEPGFDNEPTFDSEPVAEVPTPTPVSAAPAPVELPAPYSGDFAYFETTDDIRRAPLTLGESPYEQSFEEEYDQAQLIPDPLDRAVASRDINQRWIGGMRKETEVLTYNQSNVRDEGTRAIIQDKIDILDDAIAAKRDQVILTNALIPDLEAEAGPARASATPVAQPVDSPELPTETPETTQDQVGDAPQQPSNFTDTPIDEPAVADAVESEGATEAASDEPTAPVTEPVALIPVEDAPYTAWSAPIQEETEAREQSMRNLKAEVGELEANRELARKKKEIRAIDEELEGKRLALARAEVEYQEAQATERAIADARETVLREPLAPLPSVKERERADQLEAEVDRMTSEIAALNEELENTRKKKDRIQLEEQRDKLRTERAEKRQAILAARERANLMEEAEVLTLKHETEYGRKLVVILPSASKRISAAEAETWKQDPDYIAYTDAVSASEKQIQEAQVWYERAGRFEQEATNKRAEAKSIRDGLVFVPESEQAGSLQRAEQLEQEADQLSEQAVTTRKRAQDTEQEAYYAWNTANRTLIQMEDKEKRSALLAVASGVQPEVPEPVAVAEATTPVTEEAPSAPATGEGLKLAEPTRSYYSEANPIPVNTRMPEGIVFKVQIGAFRNPVAPEVFREFRPIVGESTSSGLTRYLAGNFANFEAADEAKNGIRNLGYGDAFVVAYRNGQRISLAQARAGGGGATAQPVADATPARPVGPEQPLPITSSDVQVVSPGSSLDVQTVAQRPNLFYTVQVGVFSSAVAPEDMFNITPLNSDVTESGLIRYSTGVFNTVAAASAARDRVRQLGISDAFVTAYYQGRRITVAEARRLAGTEAPAPAPVAEQPVVEQPAVQSEPEIDEFDTGSDLPAPTGSENGESFKVELGPYSGEVPIQEASVILEMNSVGVQLKREGDETFYLIGSYATAEEARSLQEIMQERGLGSTRVVKFVKGEEVNE